ncbi:MAG: ATP phosphoribosyltransferase [Flavobacteriales bacterium]|jgi:ATP phosphoribosyltransferase|tara:strand:+ start:430 stop:1290 length:861 start_codon:yes stop_codon:yes gene_type:complete
MSEILKIAVQKSGRLNEESIQLLKECGVKFNNGRDQLKVASHSFPAELLFLRNSDIPNYVKDGIADIAILGENTVIEKGASLDIIEKLGFSKCKLSLAVPKEVDYPGVQYFEGKKIATSYPVTLQQYLDKQGVKAEIHMISGSVEIAPNIGLADGICDLVSSGSTLFKNGLKECEEILFSEACLVSTPGLTGEKKDILDRLMFRINSVQTAKKSKYVLLNAPNDKLQDIIAALPGMKSPTVLPLAKEGWSSVHSVIKDGDFWNAIDDLKANGAEGILIVPIEKMVL